MSYDLDSIPTGPIQMVWDPNRREYRPMRTVSKRSSPPPADPDAFLNECAEVPKSERKGYVYKHVWREWIAEAMQDGNLYTMRQIEDYLVQRGFVPRPETDNESKALREKIRMNLRDKENEGIFEFAGGVAQPHGGTVHLFKLRKGD